MPRSKFYLTYQKTSAAAQNLGIRTGAEYQRRYTEDPKLPSRPDRRFRNDWHDWPTFLGTKSNRYVTLADASLAAQNLGIRTRAEYQRRYTEDPKLPSRPNRHFRNNWHDWPTFLGTKSNRYVTLADASLAAQNLGIRTRAEYQRRYAEDPKLPSNPDRYFRNDWHDWPTFLGRPKPERYVTLVDASLAAQNLGIRTPAEYLRRYTEDPKLPSSPDRRFRNDWHDWPTFLGRLKPERYVSLADASIAAQNLGIRTSAEYLRRYTEDPKLPSSPEQYFRNDWHDWSTFLGRLKPERYVTLADASLAAQNLGIRTYTEYQRRYTEDPKLPSNPEQCFRNNWHDWPTFLGRLKPERYVTLADASLAAQNLGIRTPAEYLRRYTEDPKLPSSPNRRFRNDWHDWPTFLGTKSNRYVTLADASLAAQNLGIRTPAEYLRRYTEDPKLPSHPNRHFRNDWHDWPTFLGRLKPERYVTLADASLAAQNLGISTRAEYLRRYAEDPKLPRNPEWHFRNDWHDWPTFLNTKSSFYLTYAEAKKAAITLRITSSKNYLEAYKKDPCLPSSPDIRYKDQWTGWTDFLLPREIHDLSIAEHACLVLSVKDSKQYYEQRKTYKFLPAHPERFDGWLDWYDFLDIPRPYPYSELVSIVRKHHCKKMEDYKKLRAELNDPRIPSSPEETYRHNGWTNTYDFFGNKRPYQVRYLTDDWQIWGGCITDFLKQARGAGTKASDLCEFVREFIEANDLDKNPLDFLRRDKINIQPCIELLNEKTVPAKKKQLFSIKEFLDWIISKDLTIEDPETGEVSIVLGARNPFQYINFNDEKIPEKINETEKLSLPYTYVKSTRDWIFPVDSPEKGLSYSDLSHLQKFNADWVQISDDFSVDSNDPDCVTKEDNGKRFIWVPVFWTYTYALMQLPARGRQIIYCDSGEMDLEIPCFSNGKIVWVANNHPKAGLTKKQGMIYKTKSGDFGVHYTSNKTQLFGEGYNTPYMPVELAYWLIKLRCWQSKFNAIPSPTPWLRCKRTFLNEVQRNFKGKNCFLFRDLNDVEPGTFGSRLSTRLGAALFFANGVDEVFAEYDGQNFTDIGESILDSTDIKLSKFSSKFTPHCMRVSLINAYSTEFGLPIEFIMKLVGHSSIVMSIYYLKSDQTGLKLRERMNKAEKEALSSATETTRRFIEQHRIEDIKSQLTANSPEFLASLTNERAAGNYVFRDFGICPVGGGFCDMGGDAVATKANIFHPVPAGHLGDQNCIQCRFFVTGPAFLVGLVALFNEVSLSQYVLQLRDQEIKNKLDSTIQEIDIISSKQYDEMKLGVQNQTLASEKSRLLFIRKQLNAEIEAKAKKMDLYLADLNAMFKHINNCHQMIEGMHPSDESKLQLMVPTDFSINLDLEDCSHFQQLCEVCENAELYHSCSDELAVTRRSQALDRMMLNNGLAAHMMHLSEREQLIVGNQFTQLMLSRLKSWEKIDLLIDGSMTLRDLSYKNSLNADEIKHFFQKAKPLKLGLKGENKNA
ncbi:integrase [Shewanella avicenniae]|uniref:Integrase n=2 Tax=Shewanella avicenniae TaxID=2814294 RepID=A0ABX7QVA4_9GAMM|nr:integrase [Shewanella avicenniae]